MSLQTKVFEGTASSYWRFSLEVIEESTSVANNTSSLTVNIWLGRTGSSSYMTGPSLNGSVVISGVGTKSFSYTSNSGTVSTGQLKLKIGSVSFTVPHSSDGTKTISISASFTNNVSPASGSLSAQSMTLTAIPRYATVTISNTSKTETSATMKWVSDSTVDYIWYSTNNGSTWTGYNTADGTSGTYTITGLSANTSYNIKIRVRRKDSQLTTDSSKLTVTTYNYPYATTMPDFTVGNSVKVTIYNPLGRSVAVTFIGADNSTKSAGTITGTSVSGFNNASWQTFLYASIPNATSGTYKIRCVYSGNTSTKTGGTYSIDASANKPSIGAVAYADENATITAITGNDQYIVQNQSNVRVTATGLSAKNSASISSCTFTYTGQSSARAMTVSGTTATANSTYKFGATSVAITATVTDSRGLTATATKTVNMVAYSAPTVNISLYRQNAYYTQSYLTATGTIAPMSVNGTQKNSIQSLVYAYKQAGTANYSADTSITSGTQYTVQMDNQYAWDFRIKITDALQTVTFTVQLPKGTPLVMFDRQRGSVSINKLPENDGTFEVDGTSHLHTVTITPASTNPYLYFKDTNSDNIGRQYIEPANHRIYLQSYRTSSNIESYRLPEPDVGTASNAIYDILTTKTAYTVDGTPSSAVAVASGSTKNVASMYLGAGTWVITANLAYASNATGYRNLYIGTSTGGAQLARVTVGAASGILTALNASSVFTSSGQYVYMNAYQNSGSSLNTNTSYSFFKAVRIF